MTTCTDWQLECIGIQNRGGRILESGVLSDCTFVVEHSSEKEMFRCHKTILAMASPVFEAMFYGSIAEDQPVTIEDIDKDIFKALLDYVYTDVININSVEMASELYYAAKKYMLPHLTKECTVYLSSNLTDINALFVYEFAKFNDDEDLMDQCIQVIRKGTKNVLNDVSFTKASLETVCMVLSMDPLNIDNELDLFKAAERYSEANEECAVLPQDNESAMKEVLYKEIVNDETTFRFNIQNTGNQPRLVDSSLYLIGNLQWEIIVVPENNLYYLVEPQRTLNYKLGIRCYPSSMSTDLWCYTSIELRVICKNPNTKQYCIKTKLYFYSAADVWYWKGLPLNNLLDPKNGYLENNTITIEAHIVTEASSDVISTKEQSSTGEKDKLTIRSAVRLIRFLSLTAEQFALGPAKSKLLLESEKNAIFIKLLTESSDDIPMPYGFYECNMRRTT